MCIKLFKLKVFSTSVTFNKEFEVISQLRDFIQVRPWKKMQSFDFI